MFSILHSALAYYNSKTQNEPSKSKTRSEHLMNHGYINKKIYIYKSHSH